MKKFNLTIQVSGIAENENEILKLLGSELAEMDDIKDLCKAINHNRLSLSANGGLIATIANVKMKKGN